MNKKLLLLAIVGLILLGILAVVILIISLLLGPPLLLYLTGLNPSGGAMQCTLPPGFNCTAYKLHAGSGELDLNISQAIGHTIKITGLACTGNSSANYTGTAINNYKSNPLTVPPSNSTSISKSGTSHVAKCTDASGNLPPDMKAGTIYSGKIYINYTEVDTGMQIIATGAVSAKYEA